MRVHTKLVFSGFAGPIEGNVRVMLRIFQDEEDLGLYEAIVRTPPAPGLDVEVLLPQPLGGSPHGEPHLPEGAYRDAVEGYVGTVLEHLEEHPDDPAAYSLHHAVEFDAEVSPGVDA
jgi:hypothetical protein